MRTTTHTAHAEQRSAPQALRADGATFEAPIHTVPYPIVSMRAASLDARDVDMDDLVPYRADA